MKEKLQRTIIYLILLMLYLVIGNYFHIYLFCPIYKFTHFYCPGCGITRMLLSLLQGRWYQAFRYNPLLFITLPLFFLYYLDSLMPLSKKRKSFLQALEPYIWYVLIVVFLIYGVLRNLDKFRFLQPTIV